MTAVLTWITSNPQAVKGYMVSVLALIAKLILAITGKVADLGVWSGFVDQAIDLLVGGLTIYGLVVGGIHHARGPGLTTTDQAATIIAALKPAPVAAAVEQVKAVVQELEAVKVPVAQSFPESHEF
jgi:hypothetical protein